MGLGLGDILTIEVIDGSIVMKPKTYIPHLPAPPKSCHGQLTYKRYPLFEGQEKGQLLTVALELEA